MTKNKIRPRIPDNVNISGKCTAHCKQAERRKQMTIEDVEKATLSDVKKLVSLANRHGIDVTVYDIKADANILAGIISDKMENSGMDTVYNFIKDVAENRAPFAVIDNYENLASFGQEDLDDLKRSLCEKAFPEVDQLFLQSIIYASTEEYSIEGVETLKNIGYQCRIHTQFDKVSVASESQAVIDGLAKCFRESGPEQASAFMEKIKFCKKNDLIKETNPPEVYTEEDFCRDRDEFVAQIRSRLTDIEI